MEQEGHSFLGARAVVGQHQLARPKSGEKRRELNPRITPCSAYRATASRLRNRGLYMGEQGDSGGA
jgi:hypothetical protein